MAIRVECDWCQASFEREHTLRRVTALKACEPHPSPECVGAVLVSSWVPISIDLLCNGCFSYWKRVMETAKLARQAGFQEPLEDVRVGGAARIEAHEEGLSV